MIAPGSARVREPPAGLGKGMANWSGKFALCNV